MHIGHNISHVRTIKQIKQRDIARRLGITQQAYSRIEKCHVIGKEMLSRVAKELGVEVPFLTSFNEEKAIKSISDHPTITIQVVLNYIIDVKDPTSLPDLAQLTRNIESFARQQAGCIQNDDVIQRTV